MRAPLHSALVARERLRLIVFVLFPFALLVPANVMAAGSGTIPTVVWSPAALDIAVAPGEPGFRQVTVTANAPADAQLVVSPAIAGFVSVSQTRVQVSPGQGTRIQFVIQASVGTIFSTFLGKAYLRAGTRVFSPALPVKVTVRPDALPPDPGEQGRATVAGVDSDGDGVRDDIEYYIDATYGRSAQAREQFRRYAAALQQTLLDEGSQTLTRANALQRLSTFECIARALNLNQQDRRRVRAEFFAHYLDTRERSVVYTTSERHLGGFRVSYDTVANPICVLRP